MDIIIDRLSITFGKWIRNSVDNDARNHKVGWEFEIDGDKYQIVCEYRKNDDEKIQTVEG